MFWLGKSLMQLKSYKEAGNVFSDLRKQFPGKSFCRLCTSGNRGNKKGGVRTGRKPSPKLKQAALRSADEGKDKMNDKLQEEKKKGGVFTGKDERKWKKAEKKP